MAPLNTVSLHDPLPQNELLPLLSNPPPPSQPLLNINPPSSKLPSSSSTSLLTPLAKKKPLVDLPFFQWIVELVLMSRQPNWFLEKTKFIFSDELFYPGIIFLVENLAILRKFKFSIGRLRKCLSFSDVDFSYYFH